MRINHVYLISSDESGEEVISQCIDISFGEVRLRDLRIITDTAGGWEGFEWTYNEKSSTYSTKFLGHKDDFPEFFI